MTAKARRLSELRKATSANSGCGKPTERAETQDLQGFAKSARDRYGWKIFCGGREAEDALRLEEVGEPLGSLSAPLSRYTGAFLGGADGRQANAGTKGPGDSVAQEIRQGCRAYLPGVYKSELGSRQRD